MKLYTSAVAMFLLVSSSFAFAANGSGPGAGAAEAVNPQPETPLMEQKMLGKPEIAGDGIQNATQVEDPSDIGSKSSTAQDSPEPVPTEGDVGVQKAK
ncbi:MAG: hypothetical protein ABFS39_04075 [Pseudomonadota bacterium]